MNKERRKLLENLKDQISDIKDSLENICSEEQDYKDNMPENFQYGDKGQKADDAISAMEEAVSNLDDAINNLDTSIE